MDIGAILNKLHGVRRTSNDSWIACCPAHNDKHPSLAIRVTPESRILIHCFAGCGLDEILTALDVTVADIQPPQSEYHHQRHSGGNNLNSSAVLYMIYREALIVAMAACDLQKGIPLNETDHARLIQAVGRITEGVNYADGVTRGTGR